MISVPDKTYTELRRCCDVTDQQASRGSCEAADSYHARLRRQFPAGSSCRQRALDKLSDYVSIVHQPRRQLLHLPSGEQGIQERVKEDDKRHIK